tara:strand:- start:500 stop:1111 length:612 start_codon:yes stop_codon:yes gene_type:complete
MKPLIIGICGGSGSGKTTLLKKIKSALGHENVSVFTMDNYYLPKGEQARDKNNSVNFDLPTALNEKQLCLDLQQLISGEEIKVKEYFFNAPVNETKTVSIAPNKVIIVEGLFLFYFEAVRASLDFSIYVDVDPKHQLSRRMVRDQKTRGYSREDILYQWKEHVVPCYEKYILPFRPTADFVFRNDDHAGDDLKRLKKELELIQ